MVFYLLRWLNRFCGISSSVLDSVGMICRVCVGLVGIVRCVLWLGLCSIVVKFGLWWCIVLLW